MYHKRKNCRHLAYLKGIRWSISICDSNIYISHKNWQIHVKWYNISYLIQHEEQTNDRLLRENHFCYLTVFAHRQRNHLPKRMTKKVKLKKKKQNKKEFLGRCYLLHYIILWLCYKSFLRCLLSAYWKRRGGSHTHDYYIINNCQMLIVFI